MQTQEIKILSQRDKDIILAVEEATTDPKNKAKFEPLPDNVVEQLRNIIAERDKK